MVEKTHTKLGDHFVQICFQQSHVAHFIYETRANTILFDIGEIHHRPILSLKRYDPDVWLSWSQARCFICRFHQTLDQMVAAGVASFPAFWGSLVFGGASDADYEYCSSLLEGHSP